MDKENERIGLQEIIDKAIEELAREAGDSFKLAVWEYVTAMPSSRASFQMLSTKFRLARKILSSRESLSFANAPSKTFNAGAQIGYSYP